jgi:hypothetical protein
MEEKSLTQEQHVRNFIKSLDAIENAMEPFKDQKRDLRSSYEENNWLSKEEMRMAVKAYRLLKSDVDMDALTDYFNQLKKTMRGMTGV